MEQWSLSLCSPVIGGTGALKMQEWKKQEWKNREQISGLENAGVEKSGANVLQFYKVCILEKCSLYVYRTFTTVLRLYALDRTYVKIDTFLL